MPPVEIIECPRCLATRVVAGQCRHCGHVQILCAKKWGRKRWVCGKCNREAIVSSQQAMCPLCSGKMWGTHEEPYDEDKLKEALRHIRGVAWDMVDILLHARYGEYGDPEEVLEKIDEALAIFFEWG